MDVENGEAFVVYADSGPGIVVYAENGQAAMDALRGNKEFKHSAMAAVSLKNPGRISDACWEVEKAGAYSRGFDLHRIRRIPTRIEHKTLTASTGGKK